MGYKIVRDRHDEIFAHHPWDWRVSPQPAMALLKKIFEEAGELAETMDPGELYDLHDVVMAMMPLMDPDGKHHVMHQHKVSRLGGFTRHLEWSPLSRDEETKVLHG